MPIEFDSAAGWRLAPLSELGEVNRGRSRHRPRHDPSLYDGKYPFIQTGDVKASGGRITTFSQTYNDRGLAQSRLWPAGTMCITIAANIAETGILTFPACFPDSIIGFVPDPQKVDVRYIEYVFRHVRRLIQHEASGSGTVQDNINLAYLARLRVPVPPLNEQQQIASLLGSLDDKINLNFRLTRTLEATAVSLFQSWFVDFDPVTAKVEGKRIIGTVDALFKEIPSCLVGDGDHAIPQGWCWGRVGHEFRVTMGQSPPGASYNENGNGIPLYQGCTDFGFRYPTRRLFTTEPTRFAEPGDTLVSVRAPVGRANMAAERCCIGRGLAAARHLSGGRSYSYYAMRALEERFAMFEGDGTLFGAITSGGFANLMVIVPTLEAIRVFERIVGVWDERIWLNERESHALAVLRDSLLPELLSGRLCVRDAAESVVVAAEE